MRGEGDASALRRVRAHAWTLYNNIVLNLMERTASERGRAFGLANSEAMGGGPTRTRDAARRAQARVRRHPDR